MQELYLFILCFFSVLIIYEIFIVNRAKKKKTKKQPIEVRYLMVRYHLNMKKVDYNQLLQLVALISSFDIALIVSIAMIMDSYLFQLIMALVLVLPVILISYHFVGKFYKKKGMTNNV